MLIICVFTEGEARGRDAKIEELVGRMSCGEMSAMGDLYDLIEKDVYAYALSKTANKGDAEDITHDTFVQVWKNATQYKPMGKPLAWIFTIEMNLIRRQFNRNQRFVPLDETIEVEPDCEDIEESVVDNVFLKRMLSILSEEEREVITLHIVSGLKHREIAKLLEKPLSTVLAKYYRAVKKLQMEIKEKEELK